MGAFEKLCNEYRESGHSRNHGRPGDGHRGSEQSDIQGGYFLPVRFLGIPQSVPGFIQ